MPTPTFISIDQNSHSLWDTVPKLATLAAHGWQGTHYIEDIDVAFTRHGAAVGDPHMELAPERILRGGASDWGAALFYLDFLGRLPIDPRRFEPFTGWTSAALARRLDISLDALYDRYAVSDNWQLVGSSYAEDTQHHRVIGDLSVNETAPFLCQLLKHAHRNTRQSFPERTACQRVDAWFASERARLDQLLVEHANGPLVALYHDWMRTHAPAAVRFAFASELFPADSSTHAPHILMDAFLKHYTAAATAYNEAIHEKDAELSPLHVESGELPCFVVWHKNDRLVRTSAWLQDGQVVTPDAAWPLHPTTGGLPLGDMAQDGVTAVAGKALMLVLQARLTGHGALALPYKGSLYMPAAFALERKLRNLPDIDIAPNVKDVVRVKFGFLEFWRTCATLVRLPDHLHAAFGMAEIKACDFAEILPNVMGTAENELAALRNPKERSDAIRKQFPTLIQERDDLNARRRELARTTEGRPEAGQLWDRIKEIDRDVLGRQVDWALQHLRVLDLDYFNSRGALLPWCIGLGGTAFYNGLVQGADIYAEKA